MFNTQELLIEKKQDREWSGLVDNMMMYGLMAIAFGLFFVRLNHIVEYAFFVLLGVWVVSQWRNGSLAWIKTSLDIPILLYLSWALICVPFAVDPAYSFGEWRKAVAQILMFYFVVQTVKTEQHILLIVLSGAAALMAFSSLESFYFLGQGRSMWDMGYRAGELTGSSQWFSVYLVIGLPLLWFAWDMTRDSLKWHRVILLGGWGVSSLGLFLSHTRGAWVAVGTQIFIYVLLKLRKNMWWSAFAGAGVLACGLLVVLLLPMFQELANRSSMTETHSMQVRFNTWSVALQDVAENPLTGIGLGKHSFGRFHPELGAGFHANLHNTFLAKAVQIGVPGFLFFIWIFIVVVARAAPLFRKFSNEWAGKLALTTSLIVVGVIVRNLFDDMFNGTVAYLFWLLMGLFFSVEKTVAVRKSMSVV